MSSYFLGIDASKGYADFVVVDSRKRIVESVFQLDDTFEGHAHLYQFLEAFCETHSTANLFAGIESTGGYENNWFHALRRFQGSLPLRVARLNPALVQKHAEAEGHRVKTDAVSASYIASFLVAYPEKVNYEQEDSLAGLRAQWRFIDQLTKQETALRNQFQTLLYSAHPELISFLSSGIPAWVLKLVGKYPTARRLAKARLESVVKIPFITRERAKELITAAMQSVASLQDPTIERLLQDLSQHILLLEDMLKTQKQVLEAQLELPEEVDLLTSFGGIGAYTAVGLLLEIQAVERFPSSKKIASFYGVHPAYKISGDGITLVKMSKQGSSRMRAMLFMITLNAIQTNPVIAPLYRRLVEEQGMEKMAAIGVCMHKTLRLLYGMLKHRQAFNPEVEREHRQRYRSEADGASSDRKRRYQHYDQNAPVSARAKKRRRQQKHSQSVVHAAYGMLTPTIAYPEQRASDSKSSFKEQSNPA